MSYVYLFFILQQTYIVKLNKENFKLASLEVSEPSAHVNIQVNAIEGIRR